MRASLKEQEEEKKPTESPLHTTSRREEGARKGANVPPSIHKIHHHSFCHRGGKIKGVKMSLHVMRLKFFSLHTQSSKTSCLSQKERSLCKKDEQHKCSRRLSYREPFAPPK